jgi:glutamate dehydrogenase (NAD(P)+)
MLQDVATMEIVTGKPVPLGGSRGRREATGRGVALITGELLSRMGRSLAETTVAIQGYGNVGQATATILHRMGCRIVAVSDISGGLFDPRGVDIDAVNQHVADHPLHQLAGYAAPGVVSISNHELLTADVDVLIPAALEHQIHIGNVSRVRASMIVEAANGPTTPEADEVLAERGVTVVPDILANAGGVVVSYFEWVQDMQCFFWEEAEVNRHLKRIMVEAFQKVWKVIRERGVPLRTGACLLAVHDVAEAIAARGIFP